LPSDVLRDQLPGAIKVGSVEAIRDLVNNQLPGIAMSALPVAPREIPFHAGSIYFQLDSNSELWSQLRDSGGFAFHIAGDFPSFELELWAIRN
jgi:type VI secretion system protein ImpJ